MLVLTPADFPARPRAKQSRGARLIPIDCLMRSCVMSIQQWRFPSLRLMLWLHMNQESQSGFTIAVANSWICWFRNIKNQSDAENQYFPKNLDEWAGTLREHGTNTGDWRKTKILRLR